MKNKDIRSEIAERGFKLWQIADKLGMNDGNFSRKLRHELPDDEKRRVLDIIAELERERKYNA